MTFKDKCQKVFINLDSKHTDLVKRNDVLNLINEIFKNDKLWYALQESGIAITQAINDIKKVDVIEFINENYLEVK